MKIVVDKKITKLDGDVEDILSTSQLVDEGNGLRVIETAIGINSNYELSVTSLKELHIESDYPIEIEINKMAQTIVHIYNKREFSIVGNDQYYEITLTNNNQLETEIAKIKIVVVE